MRALERVAVGGPCLGGVGEEPGGDFQVAVRLGEQRFDADDGVPRSHDEDGSLAQDLRGELDLAERRHMRMTSGRLEFAVFRRSVARRLVELADVFHGMRAVALRVLDDRRGDEHRRLHLEIADLPRDRGSRAASIAEPLQEPTVRQDAGTVAQSDRSRRSCRRARRPRLNVATASSRSSQRPAS